MAYIVEAIKTDGYSGGYLANVNGEVRFVHSMKNAAKFSENSNIEHIAFSLKAVNGMFPHSRFYKFEIRTYVPGYVGDLVRAVLAN